MNNNLQYNLSLINKHCPDAYKILIQHKPVKIALYDTKNNEKTFKINKLFIHSQYNPSSEAERILSSYGEIASNSLFIFINPGIGYIIENVLNKANPYFIIAESNPEILLLSLTKIKLPDNNKWHIILRENTTVLDDLFKTKFNILYIDKINYIILPVFEKISPDIIQYFKKSITSSIDNAVGETATLSKFGLLLQENIIKNLPYYINSTSINRYRNKYKDVPAVIVGAGPSLDKNIYQLKKIRYKTLILAVDTVYPVLKRKNINPDFTFSVDPQKESIEHFKNISKVGNFVLDLTSYHRLPGLIKNNLIYFVSSHPLSVYIANYMEREHSQFTTGGGTASAIALQAAVYFGCNPVILIGQDFALNKYQMYCKGTMYDLQYLDKTNKFNSLENYYSNKITKNSKIEITSIKGNRLYTNHNMIQYKKWFENYVHQINTKVINCTYDGTNIDSIENSNLYNLNELFKESINKTLNINYNKKSGSKSIDDFAKKYYKELKNIENNPDKIIIQFNQNNPVIETLSIVLYSYIFKKFRRKPGLTDTEKNKYYIEGIIKSVKFTKNLLKKTFNVLQ